MAGRVQDKVAIVCGAGASAGGVSIGMASAVRLAQEGAKIFAVDRDPSLATETAERIAAIGGECALHACDVTDEPAVAAMAQACLARYGRIDILFNNVGIYGLGGPLETSREDFERMLGVNLTSMFLTCKVVLPTMLEQGGGAIVNNASLAAIRYQLASLAYSVSKAGVVQLTQSIALQYAARGIRCNCVLPGNILTDRLVTRLKRTFGEAYVDHVRAWGEQVPSGEVGEPWDVANAVLFLASDEARYINAVELPVDAGLSASVIGRTVR